VRRDLRPSNRSIQRLLVFSPLLPANTARVPLHSLVDGVGTTKYTYTAAGQLLTEDGPFASDTVTNAYSNCLRTKPSLRRSAGTLSSNPLGTAVIWGLLLIGFGVCSCKRPSVPLKEQKGNVDVSNFILSEMLKYGGSNRPAGPASVTGITNYSYSEDRDGFQVVCKGNRVAELCNIFGSQFGSPVLTKTNETGLAGFVYSDQQAGLAVNCGVFTNANQEITHLIVVKAGAL
jgi:hypothetical protein